MVRKGWLAALVVALAPWPCPAQFGGMGGMGPGMRMGGGMGGMGMPDQEGEEWTVKFETFDGQSVTGKLRLPSVAVECSLGLYEIKPGKIKSVQLSPMGKSPIVGPGGFQREGSVVTDSGETVAGKINVPGWWKLETELGTLTPDAQHLKTLTFVSRVEESADQRANRIRPAPSRRVRPTRPAEDPARPAEPASPAEPPKDAAKPTEPTKPGPGVPFEE